MSKTLNRIKMMLRLVVTSRSIIIIACLIIVVGYVLMAGPGSNEQAFNPDIFSTRRIVVAPVVCLIGYLLIVVGILRRKA